MTIKELFDILGINNSDIYIFNNECYRIEIMNDLILIYHKGMSSPYIRFEKNINVYIKSKIVFKLYDIALVELRKNKIDNFLTC